MPGESRSARLVGVGVFVLVTVTLFAVGLFMIGDRQMAFARKFTVYTEFAKVTGLQPGAIIRVSGAKGGSVKSIRPPSRPTDKFRIELEITEDLHPLVRTDSIASIETEGLVGGAYLAVGTGSDRAPAAPPGSTIPSREPFEIADLMQQMSGTIRKVNETIEVLAAEVQNTLQTIGGTVENVNQLVDDVTDDVKTITSAGARITGDAAEIADKIRKGEGTIGKLVNDDELYRRTVAIVKSAEDIAADTQRVVQEARKALEGLQSKDGPVNSLTADVRRTMEDARDAMTGFAENMDALKRNFLFRGFFNDRGYFSLSEISPAAYRAGALTTDKRRARNISRTWLGAGDLFEADPEQPGVERLTDGGRRRLDAAIAPSLSRLPGNILIIEGYAQQGTIDEQYVRSRARAAVVRDYLIDKFHLEARATGVMPLGADSAGSPGGQPWDGLALAVFLRGS